MSGSAARGRSYSEISRIGRSRDDNRVLADKSLGAPSVERVTLRDDDTHHALVLRSDVYFFCEETAGDAPLIERHRDEEEEGCCLAAGSTRRMWAP